MYLQLVACNWHMPTSDVNIQWGEHEDERRIDIWFSKYWITCGYFTCMSNYERSQAANQNGNLFIIAITTPSDGKS